MISNRNFRYCSGSSAASFLGGQESKLGRLWRGRPLVEFVSESTEGKNDKKLLIHFLSWRVDCHRTFSPDLEAVEIAPKGGGLNLWRTVRKVFQI